MSIGLLDLNDSNLQLWHRDALVQSTGYALLQGGEYLFGAPARAAARLQPRDINTRFWWQLSTETLQPALGPARHTGDLVHAHLMELHAQANGPDELLLAVPGSMAHEQLALLLGIVQQCPFDAVGLVNRSVALGSLYSRGERLFHLEIQLHQAVISELADRGGQIELQRTIPLPGCGLLQLQERLVELISAEFVRQTRFDPRRKAATEQQLYDELPAALRALHTSAETNLDINGYQARVSRDQLQAAGKRLFDSAKETIGVLHPGDRVIADPLTALLPGLTTAFGQLDILQADDMHRALQLHESRLVQREQALSFITALPSSSSPRKHSGASAGTFADTPDKPAPPPAPKPVCRATHLLTHHVAQPLIASGTALAQGCELYRSDEGWLLRGATAGTTVNRCPYQSGQTLDTGDIIDTGAGTTATLIEVRV
ncbi:Uncharacterised protein [Halioglobus japonicus]|nr:Uncharacterised protein [Halioglobus japonicus]